jgi:hypothetical protein
MNYKWFLQTDTSVLNQINKLKKQYPKCFFKDGKHDGKSGIWILSTLDKIEWHENTVSGFQPNSKFWLAESDYNSLITIDAVSKELNSTVINPELNEHKVCVELSNGLKLFIRPATLEPRGIVFSLDDAESLGTDLYSQATEFGRLAFDVYNKIESGSIKLSDPLLKKLVSFGLNKSYSVPVELFSILRLVPDYCDYEKIIHACLGHVYNEEEKKTT